MASDFAAAAFFLPLLLVMVGLLVAAFRLKPLGPGQAGIADVGLRRLVHGYIAVLVVILLYCIADSVRLGFSKVHLGHIETHEIKTYFIGWVVGHFIIMAVLALVVITVLIVPILALLSKVYFASTFALVMGAFSWSGIWVWRAYAVPYNSWCAENLAMCASRVFWGSIEFSLPVALAFGLGTRLPPFRSANRVAS